MSSVEARVESESVLHARKSDPIQMARLKIRLLPLGLGIAGVLLCAALICINSCSIFFSLLEFECEHRSAALEAIMLDIAEQRFGDDPKFQSAIGLMSFERSKEESLRAVVMLDRAIDSKV